MTSSGYDLAPDAPCRWCGGELRPLYRMGDYQTWQCRRCNSGTTSPLPPAEELRRFYDQFAFAADAANLRLYKTDPVTRWLRGFGFRAEARLLDVGGGGGFMARAFQDAGLGEAHYVDLDASACLFAGRELGLRHVRHADVCELPHLSGVRYDLIYCRHVLEHVRDPFEMLRRMMALLADDGVIELILPNGASLEYLGYPELLRRRVDTIVRSNPELSEATVWRSFWTGRIAHGLDPIRHLWAVTPKGITAWLSRQPGIRFSVCTKPLSHSVYSMYNAGVRRSSWQERVRTFCVNRSVARVRGACHLVARIRSVSGGQVSAAAEPERAVAA